VVIMSTCCAMRSSGSDGVGLQFPAAGSRCLSNVFARPGIGRLAVNAIATRDYPAVQGIVLFTAAVYAL